MPTKASINCSLSDIRVRFRRACTALKLHSNRFANPFYRRYICIPLYISMKSSPKTKLFVEPLDASNWNDFELLFGERGACGGCWCMSWRLMRSEFDAGKGAKNKSAMKRLVRKGEPTGLLAYDGDQPVGWLSMAPREEFVRLQTSRVLRPVDDLPVWSLPCLFIAKEWRRKGVSVILLRAAIQHAKQNGISILEGYPEEPYDENIPAAFAWKGIPSSFKKAGFVVAEQRTPKKP